MIFIKRASWKDLMKVYHFLKTAGSDFPDPYFKVTDKKFDCIRVFVRLIKHLLLNSFQRLAGYSTVMLLAEANSRVEGIAYMGVRNSRALLHGIYVDRDSRRRRVGSRLLRAAMDFCSERNYALGLYVRKDNLIAVDFYRKMGFEAVSSDNGSIYMKLTFDDSTCG
jgi:ribosomal protein S18 acetylase RimI-like enzyme